MHRNYKVAQKSQSCAEHLALRDLFKIGLSFAALQYNYRPSNILQKEFQSNPAECPAGRFLEKMPNKF